MRPAAALMAALITWALVGVGVVAAWLPMQAFVVVGIVLVLIATQDLLLLRAIPTPEVQRDLPNVVPVGVERMLSLRLRHVGKRPQVVQVQDLHPGDWPVFGGRPGIFSSIPLPPPRSRSLMRNSRSSSRPGPCALTLSESASESAVTSNATPSSMPRNPRR